MFIVIKSEHYDCTNLICKKDTLEDAVAAVKDSMAQRINKNYHTGLTGADITHGYVKYDKSMIVSKDETTVNRIAEMLDSMGFDAVTGYFDPEEDKRSGEVDSLTGYYYVDI